MFPDIIIETICEYFDNEKDYKNFLNSENINIKKYEHLFIKYTENDIKFLGNKMIC